MKKTITTLLFTLLCIFASNAQDYTVEPASGTTVENLTDIYITWPEGSTIDVDMTMMQGGIKTYMVDGDNKVFTTDVFCGPAFGNYVMLTMMSPTTDAGDYVVEIPDKMFTVNGNAIEAFSLYYTISGIPTSTASIEMSCDNNSLSNIFITVSPCTELQINEGEEVEAPFLIKNDGFNSHVATQYTITITGANTATLTTGKEIGNGEYTLHIPKGCLLIDGKLNKLVYKDFRISAITKVENDKQQVNVYNLQGVQVVNNGSTNEMNNLQPGIYIVNGEKKLIQRGK
ncbi:MAG: hypothetical protein E7084_00060 [Bacteroidales bacterium]|nr:hypothetical protein [Bacteroidales bacterium]